ncbi:predicted SAM-methyltransferase [Desulforapulum autotrophicum HRM2]|uniref:Predicted SAM-methyltransferase n=2 Tax=Desulforapulum autotrophicum TaxID=2296 RepID=C0QES9_DESAH|nr:predicted SAM-methyltransferase [Desulforapulum autotrophicum HRM2]
MVDSSTRITGIGSALVDLLINETDGFLEALGKEKGGMTLVEHHDQEEILGRSTEKPVVVPGGAACNTIVGTAKLGGEARFIGMRGTDAYGDQYEAALRRFNVEPLFNVSTSTTGRVLSVITPDAQRSMFTHLGASVEMDPLKVLPELFTDTAIAVIEGYLLFNPDLMLASLKSAKAAGAKIALDLASFEVVEASRPILADIIADYVDILIANEDEAKAYTGFTDESAALKALSKNVDISVLKVGKRGSHVAANGRKIRIDPQKGKEAVDTTGAGDLWASGFLYGVAHGYSLEQSGKIGSACGYEVCQVVGAQVPDKAWDRIKQLL